MRWALLPIALLVGPSAAAQALHLIDLNRVGTPVSGLSSAYNDSAAIGGVLYFRACLPATGCELWRSDGTALGTSMVADLVPGPGSCNPVDLVSNGLRLYFICQSPSGAAALWTSQGTAATTSTLASFSSYVQTVGIKPQLSGLTGKLVLSAVTAAAGREPWASDGTVGGTALLSDLVSGMSSSLPGNFATVNGYVVFTTSAAANDALYRTNGNTVIQTANFVGAASEFRSTGAMLYAIHNTSSMAFRVLTRTDGSGGLSAPLETYFSMSSLTLSTLGTYFIGRKNSSGQNQIFYRAFTGSNDTAFQVSNANYSGSGGFDGLFTIGADAVYVFHNGSGTTQWNRVTPANVTNTLNAPPGTSDSFLAHPARIYFQHTNANFGSEPWWTDGLTSNNTRMLRDIQPGPASGGFAPIGLLGTTAFFAADDGAIGQELWKTDGTPAGTVLVADLEPSFVYIRSSDPGSFVAAGSQVVFFADDGVNGREPWVSDGTDAGTRLLFDTVPGPVSTAGCAGGVASLDGVAWLHLSLDGGPCSLFTTDGTPAGTQPVMPQISRFFSTPGGPLVTSGSSVFRITDAGPSPVATWSVMGSPVGVLGDRLLLHSNAVMWALDLIDGGTSVLADPEPALTSDLAPANTTFTGRLAYFVAETTAAGRELWVTDGRSAAQVADLHPGAMDSWPRDFVTSGDTLFFVAFTPDAGDRLWKSDGTAAGTQVVADPDPTDLTFQSGKVWPIADLGWDVLYAERAMGSDLQLVTTDGTSRRVVGVVPQPWSWARVGAKLYFEASLPDGGGREPWVTDGTLAGTGPFANLHPGDFSYPPGDSQPQGWTVAGTTLYVAAVSLEGRELWAGTVDPTPPVVTPSAVGPPGNTGWFRGDVAVSFTVVDPESGVLDTSGCTGPFDVTVDTADAGFVCEAHSGGGVRRTRIHVRRDATAPLISCPTAPATALAVAPSGADVFFGTATASDPFTASPRVTADWDGGRFPVGTTRVTFSATDEAGNAATCGIDVTVEDRDPPTFICPDSRTVDSFDGGPVAVAYGPPRVLSDLVDPSPTVSYAPADGTAFEIGAHTVTGTARDSSDGGTSCTFVITVDDKRAPQVAVTPRSHFACGCAGAPGALAGLLATLLLSARRRRRRATASRT